MTSHLTAGQRAQLESALRLRQGELDRRLAAHNDGKSRAEHARDVYGVVLRAADNGYAWALDREATEKRRASMRK